MLLALRGADQRGSDGACQAKSGNLSNKQSYTFSLCRHAPYSEDGLFSTSKKQWLYRDKTDFENSFYVSSVSPSDETDKPLKWRW